MSAWQPIESAPRDGTYVLVCIPGCVPAVARWSDYFGHWTEFDDIEEANREGEDGWGLKYWQHHPKVPHD